MNNKKSAVILNVCGIAGTGVFALAAVFAAYTIVSNMRSNADASAVSSMTTYSTVSISPTESVYDITTNGFQLTTVSEANDSYINDDSSQLNPSQSEKEYENENENDAVESDVSDSETDTDINSFPANNAPEDENAKNEPNENDTKSVQSPEYKDSVYIIQNGDTLSHISAVTGVSVDELAAYNHIHDVNVIYADSALRIPAK